MSKIKAIEEEYKPDAGIFSIGMTRKEIRVLTFWACTGISNSRGGSYEKVAPKMVKYFAKHLNIKLPCKPVFKLSPIITNSKKK